MKVELLVALISGVVALVSAGGTILSSIKIEKLKTDNEKRKDVDQKNKEMSGFSEPFARSAYHLQSRLYNIVRQNFIDVFLTHGSDRERSYATNNTVFLIAQYFCWTELVRREIQFIDLGEHDRTRELSHLQDNIERQWGTDQLPPNFRIFAGEQRALGEALIVTGLRGQECMGYGRFLKTFDNDMNPLIDSLRQDVLSLSDDLCQAQKRLKNIQHSLIDLLNLLDPTYLRFPETMRTKL